MALHPKTERLMSWAKRSAKAHARTQIGLDDLVCAFALLTEEGGLLGPPQLPILSYRKPSAWPTELEVMCSKVKTQAEVQERFPLEPALKQVVDQAYAEDPELSPLVLLDALRVGGSPLIKSFYQAIEPLGEASKNSSLVEFFSELSSNTRALVEGLEAKVLGQGMAARMLGDAFYKASLGIQRSGPKGVFTFLGPPGVGKTHMARTFSTVVPCVDAKPYVFKRFDLGEFSGPQSHEQLFGSPAVYRNAGPGTLTGFVKANPSAILLFDELEKAHPNTILSFLSFLDSGEATDQNLGESISFRDTWVIFTTNLGHEFFASNNQAGFLDGTSGAQSLAFEILASSNRKGSGGSSSEGPILPPEFISRLAKGGAAIFKELAPSDHLRLVDNTLKAEFGEEASGRRPALPAMHLSESARLLFLLSLLPDLDARRTIARTGDWVTSLLRGAFEHLDSQKMAAGKDIHLHIDCDAATQAYLEELDAQGALKVLLVDEDAYLEHSLGELGQDLKVQRVEGMGEAVSEVLRFQPDLALLDLSLHEDLNSTSTSRALEILRAIREASPELPVYLFSENPDNREGFQQVAAQVLRYGGARAFLPLQRDLENPVLMEHFLGLLEQIFAETRRDRTVRAERRRHRATAWNTSFSWDPTLGRIQATLNAPSAAVLLGSIDGDSPIRFSGVPTDRLTDLVGLKRAKRRLQQVVDWLQDPSILERFSVPPPRGFLLEGPPGTGKTMLARAFAGTAGLPFLALSAGELQSKWVGESEERIRELFARAREFAPAIIFIDEIDGIALRRTEHQGSHSRSLLNQLLASMDGFSATTAPIFVLAATNHADQLDPAILRPGRFDEVIPVDRPNAEARRIFLTRRIGEAAAAALDLDPLVRSTCGCTPAELDRIVREAVYLLASEGGTSLTWAVLDRACRLVIFGAEHEELRIRPEEKEVTAIHEAGHALAQMLCFPDRSVGFLTIVPNERGALGFMAPESDEERHDLTERDLRKRLVVALAGREAELLKAGKDQRDLLTTGASGDLQMATRLAWLAITRYGLDPEFGLVSIEGLPVAERANLVKRGSDRVVAWLNAASQEAAKLLSDNRDWLQALADALIQAESLDGEDLRRLIQDREIPSKLIV